MNIDGQAEFEGTGNTYLRVRDCLRVMGKQLFVDRYWYDEVLAGDLENPIAVFDALIEHGYLEAEGTINFPVWNRETRQNEQVVRPRYTMTSKAYAVANASAASPVHRATAEKALAGFLERVEQAAADPLNLWVVDRVVLFGSMLDPTRQRVSDVDLAVRLIENEAVFESAGGHQLAGSVFLAEMNGGRHPSGYRGEYGVRRFLKGRSRVLSLANLSADGAMAGLSPDTPHRVLYERPPIN
ncbi:hypothetical protein DFR70_12273 [Nocardia tenerifensis]|uniref:Uncharacterized protein n=1 Tax=Nocardia tenerifensis TaxID=228006 RepID=A0A318JQ40_9NOCA|nr:hypothetical protein [Nocardia tenerifensis]PXX54932.1 hypothetical protein DFR70_12273 [Nocardia tenerifensis]